MITCWASSSVLHKVISYGNIWLSGEKCLLVCYNNQPVNRMQFTFNSALVSAHTFFIYVALHYDYGLTNAVSLQEPWPSTKPNRSISVTIFSISRPNFLLWYKEQTLASLKLGRLFFLGEASVHSFFCLSVLSVAI